MTTQQQAREALLPCPWCGCKPELFRSPRGSRIVCNTERCKVQPAAIKARTYLAAIAAWNTRTQRPDVPPADAVGEAAVNKVRVVASALHSAFIADANHGMLARTLDEAVDALDAAYPALVADAAKWKAADRDSQYTSDQWQVRAEDAEAERDEARAECGKWKHRVLRIERDALGLQSSYDELILAVARKFPNETRHETALRYIRERETPSGDQRDAAMQGEKP